MLDALLSRLDLVRRSGKYFTARCPCHDDHSPSLSVWEWNGLPYARCWACQALTREVHVAVGLDWHGRPEPTMPYDLALLMARGQSGQRHRAMYATADAERHRARLVADLSAELLRVVEVVRRDCTAAGASDETWDMLEEVAAIETYARAMIA